MAVAYVEVAELRERMAIDDSAEDALLQAAIDAASDGVDEYCGRTFTVPTAATVEPVRMVRALGGRLLFDGFDIANTTGLVVKSDDNDDGVFETTWTITTDFVLEQLGARHRSSTWPYQAIRSVGSRWWPWGSNRDTVQITARFGWPAVPNSVKQATLISAAELWKLKDAPFGVAGFGEFGALRVRENPMVAAMLERYKHPVVWAVVG
jgi:hypothetical protein